MESFKVLPPLGGPGPPPAPTSPRVAPRVRQHKEASAFVVLPDIGQQPISGRSSPFRGRGFRGAPSRIPVMSSAPSSPVRKPQTVMGKSAPASPSKPRPAKRVNAVSAKPPPSPRKPGPAPKPRLSQKTDSKEEIRPKAAARRIQPSTQTANKTPNPESANEPKKVVTTTYDRFGRPVESNASLKKKKQTVAKMNDPERLNGRPRPTDKPITNGRTMTKPKNTSTKVKKEVNEVMKKSEESLLKAVGPSVNKMTNGTAGSSNSLAPSNGLKESMNPKENPSPNLNGHMPLSNGLNHSHSSNPNNTTGPKDLVSDKTGYGPKEPIIIVENIPIDGSPKNKTTVPSSDSNLLNVEILPVANNTTAAGGSDVPKSPDAVSVAEMLTGSTTADVEPVKDYLKTPENVKKDITANKEFKNPGANVNTNKENEANPEGNRLIPNGNLVPGKDGVLQNGVIQNKIIIHQSDKNGPVHVIGSLPVTGDDLDEIIRESIKTETIVPGGEVLENGKDALKKDNQPDLIPSDKAKEVAGTVTGAPDVEVEARNSVSFRTGVVRMTHHPKTASQKPVQPSKPRFGFPFATFPAKKFMKLRGRKKQQERPPSSGRKTFLGIQSLNRMARPQTKSRRFTSLAKLTRTFGGGTNFLFRKQPTRPPSARKFSAVAGLTNMGIKVTGEVRPDWTVQEDEPEYVSCCCCRRKTIDRSRDKIIRSKSLERMETIDKDAEEEGEETPEKEEKGRKKNCLCCCCGNEESEDEEAENETEETEVKAKPTKSKKKAFCWRRQDSSDDVRSNGTKLSEVQLLPGKLESEGAKTKGGKWAVKTKSQEAQDYVPPKKKKKRCFWCCYKTEESNKVEDVQSSQIQPTEEVMSSAKIKSKGRNLAKLKSQDSRQSELDCNRKCKVCWLACCCGCTCSTKPHTKSMAIQAMSADIRTSMMQLPGQLRVPSTNDSGDAMVIQSLSSADNRLLTAARSLRGASSQGTSKDITAIGSMLSGNQKKLTPKTDQGRGPSPDRPSLDPNVQRSVSAVMRHLSPDRKKKGCACFSCYKKSPEVHRKSVKRKTNWICCTVRKKKKTSSQESLTSISKLPPDVQPTPAPGEKKKKKKSTVSCWGKKKMSPEIHPVSARKRKKTLGEKLCGGWLKTKGGKVPLKAKRRAGGGKGAGWCCGWKKKGPPKTGAQPPAKERRSLKSILCGCFKTKKSKPKEQPKQGLCRRMFCCCCKPKLAPAPTSVSATEATQQAGVAGGKKNEMPPLKPLTRPNLWKRIFCCKCQKSPDLGSRKSYGSKRGDMASRASSLASFPKLEATLVEHSSMMKAAIPVLPICLAWTCLILNVFIPGSGTIMSGFLCVCFGKPRFSVKDSTFARLGALCVNIVIGVGQMFTIIFCFVGWGWSIWWGVIMLRLSRKYRRIKQAELNPIETPVNQDEDAENGH